MQNEAVAFNRPNETNVRHLAAIVREFEFTLIALSLTASICSARAFLRPVSDDVDASYYLPGEPRLTSAASLGLDNPGICALATFALTHFNDLVHNARTATRAVVAIEDAQLRYNSGLSPRTIPAAVSADWVDASSRWRRAATAGISAVTAINAQTIGDQSVVDQMLQRSTDRYAGTLVADDFEKLLRDVVAGGSPCIDANGYLQYPHWAERRRHERHRLAVPATLYLAMPARQTVGHPATIQDASYGGLGLIAPGLGKSLIANTGTRITVVTIDGRNLSGIVVWAADDQIGVRFLEPLFANDPLFTDRAKPTGKSLT